MIDISFDMRTDSCGLDPDSHSLTLRKYHQLLWSKKLPNCKELTLDDNLVSTTDICSYTFSSDSIIHSYSK